MKEAYCDVIGCHRPVAWVRAVPHSESQEDRLCETCMGYLRTIHPELPGAFLPVISDRANTAYKTAFSPESNVQPLGERDAQTSVETP